MRLSNDQRWIEKYGLGQMDLTDDSSGGGDVQQMNSGQRRLQIEDSREKILDVITNNQVRRSFRQ